MFKGFRVAVFITERFAAALVKCRLTVAIASPSKTICIAWLAASASFFSFTVFLLRGFFLFIARLTFAPRRQLCQGCHRHVFRRALAKLDAALADGHNVRQAVPLDAEARGGAARLQRHARGEGGH